MYVYINKQNEYLNILKKNHLIILYWVWKQKSTAVIKTQVKLRRTISMYKLSKCTCNKCGRRVTHSCICENECWLEFVKMNQVPAHPSGILHFIWLKIATYALIQGVCYLHNIIVSYRSLLHTYLSLKTEAVDTYYLCMY